MGLQIHDYPVIDITQRFCTTYISGKGLIDLDCHRPTDKIVLEWLQGLRDVAKSAETAVLVAEFRGRQSAPDPYSPARLLDGDNK